jgi:hypothetical protein
LANCFSPGDVVVADRCYAGYFMMALLMLLGVDVVVRQHQCRDTDFRRGHRLGRRDHVVIWVRPPRPAWMDDANYEAMPATLILREVRVGGWTLVSTFTDAKAVHKRELLDLYRLRWQVGVSSQGHIVQSVEVRPRPKDSGLVAWEAPWRESKTAEPSDNMFRKEHAQRTRLQRTVNVEVASLHVIPVAETVYNARRQQGLERNESDATTLTGGVSAATWCEGRRVNWRNPWCPVGKAHRGGVAYNREWEVAAQAPGWRIGS